MVSFMERADAPVLLANDPMEAFDDLLHHAGRRIRRLSADDERPIVWFVGRDDPERSGAAPRA
jgi:hypothetical protein